MELLTSNAERMTRAPNRKNIEKLDRSNPVCSGVVSQFCIMSENMLASGARRIVQTNEACTRRFQSDGCVCVT